MKHRLLFILSFVFLSDFCFGQNSPFSNDQINKFAAQAKDYVKDFTKTVEALAKPNKNCDSICVKYKIEGTIKHFKRGATVQTISLSKTKPPRTWALVTYLKSIVGKYPLRFKFVTTEFEQITVDPSTLRESKDKDGRKVYIMSGSFSQIFCAKNKSNASEENDLDIDSMDICERTNKTFEIEILKKTIASEGTRWVVLIGDIKAKSIENLK